MALRIDLQLHGRKIEFLEQELIIYENKRGISIQPNIDCCKNRKSGK